MFSTRKEDKQIKTIKRQGNKESSKIRNNYKSPEKLYK